MCEYVIIHSYHNMNCLVTMPRTPFVLFKCIFSLHTFDHMWLRSYYINEVSNQILKKYNEIITKRDNPHVFKILKAKFIDMKI